MIAPYKYKKPSNRAPRFTLNRYKSFNSVTDREPLTGWVNGLEASDIEERFARGLRNLQREFQFQVEFNLSVNDTIGADPRDFKRVDFLVSNYLEYPVEIYGEIGHDTAAEQGKDELREFALNDAFKGMGLRPLQVVWWWELDTQDMADRKAETMFA